MLSEREYIQCDKQLADKNPPVACLCDFVINMMSDESAGWLEHAKFINAYNNGLQWWITHTGGRWLYELMIQYASYLDVNGYENLPKIEGI